MIWRGMLHVWGRGDVYTEFWWGKSEGKRPLGRPRRRREDTMKMNLQELGCGGMEYFDLAQDRDSWRALVKGVMNLRFP